jgi:hypothetical protein
MNFFIKKDSNLPEIRYHLTQRIREEYSITNDMLENVAVTFSMINSDTGLFQIANVGADIEYKVLKPLFPNDIEYYLVFKLKTYQTKKVGNYVGEFCLDFLNDQCSNKIKLPTNDVINIIISDSITKTSVI